jgi:hypothetical protein
MTIINEIDSKSKVEKRSALFKTFKINVVKVISPDDSAMSAIKEIKKN